MKKIVLLLVFMVPIEVYAAGGDFFNIAEHFYKKNKMDSALFYYSKVSKEQNGIEKWGESKYKLAKCHFRTHHLDSATVKYFDYIKLCDRGVIKNDFREESITELIQLYTELDNGVLRLSKDIKKFYPALEEDEEIILYTLAKNAENSGKLQNALLGSIALIAKYPNSIYAVEAQDIIIKVYTKAKKFEKAKDERISLIEEYNINSKWYSKNRDNSTVINKSSELVKDAMMLVGTYCFYIATQQNDQHKNFRTAVKYYEMYIAQFGKDDPFQTYEIMFYLATCYQGAQMYEKAAKTFEVIANMDTKKFPAEKLATLKFNSETAAFNSVISYESRNLYYNNGFNTEEMTECINACYMFIKNYPESKKNQEIKVKIGEMYFKGKQWDKVIEIYSDFIKKNKVTPYDQEVFKKLAQAYYYGRYYKIGEEQLTEYLHRFGNKISSDERDDIMLIIGVSIYGQAEVAQDSGNISDAIDNYIRIHKVSPKSGVADIGIWKAAELYEKGKIFSKAAKTYIFMQEMYPKSKSAIPALLRSGQIYEKNSLPDSAASVYLSIAEKYPDILDAIRSIYTAAKMYESLKMFSKAGATYEKAESMNQIKNRKRDESLYFAGLMYEKAENWDNAIRVYQKIEKAYPTSKFYRNALYSIALTYKEQERWEEASTYFEIFGDMHEKIDPPISLLSYMDAADCVFKYDGDLQKADTMLDKALAVYKTYGEKYAISQYYAAKATFLKGEVDRLRVEKSTLLGYTVTATNGEIAMEQVDRMKDEELINHLQNATVYYTSVGMYHTEEWTLKANNAIGCTMCTYALKYDSLPLDVRSIHQKEREAIKQRVMVAVPKFLKKQFLLKSAERFLVNIDYGIVNKVRIPVIDSAKINFTKIGFLAADSYFEMAEIMKKRNSGESFPSGKDYGFSGESNDVSQILTSSENVSNDLKMLALPLLESVLRVSYEKGIDNIWTDKTKERIRELNPNSLLLLQDVATIVSKNSKVNIRGKHNDIIGEITRLTSINRDGELVNGVTFEQLMLKLDSLKNYGSKLVAEARNENEKISLEVEKIQKEMDSLKKDIFILGGGKEETFQKWKDGKKGE